MSLVADFVGPSDWTVMSELGLTDGDAERVAAAHQLSPRGLRTVRDRVSQAAHTVRAALAAADAGLPLTGSVIVSVRAGTRRLPRGRRDDRRRRRARSPRPSTSTPGSARARIATAKRLLTIARAVLEQEMRCMISAGSGSCPCRSPIRRRHGTC